MKEELASNNRFEPTFGSLRAPSAAQPERCRGRFAPATTGRRISIRCLRGAKRRTTTRIKPTPSRKACGFPARRGLSAAPLGYQELRNDISPAVPGVLIYKEFFRLIRVTLAKNILKSTFRTSPIQPIEYHGV